jgi:GWxTD domain-containing protein
VVQGLLLEPESATRLTAPELLGRLDDLFRRLHPATLDPRTVDRGEVKREIRRMAAKLRSLGLGPRELISMRWSGARDARTRRVAGILAAEALSWLRLGTVDGRVRARRLLERALSWNPEDPLVAVLLARVLRMGSYASRAREVLDDFPGAARDLVDLERIRLLEGLFQGTGEEEELRRALEECQLLVERTGGPAWALLELARLQLEAGAWEEAEATLRRARARLAPEPQRPGDRATLGRIHLLQAFLAGERLDFSRAADLYRKARVELAAIPATRHLSDLLEIPWDLLTEAERMEYDQSPDRAGWLRRFWAREDPILATPGVLENRVLYWNRVAAAAIHFSQLRLELTGPETDPGRAVLRFGWPDSVAYAEGQPWQTPFGAVRNLRGLDFAVYRNIVFTYRFRLPEAPDSVLVREVVFQDRGGDQFFTAVDSLSESQWPPRLFDLSFGDRFYPLWVDVVRFYDAEGALRLGLGLETLWPDPTVEYPLLGRRFQGSMDAVVTRYVPENAPALRAGLEPARAAEAETVWVPRETRRLTLNVTGMAEDRGRTYRRCAAWATWKGLPLSPQRLACLLRLRDLEGKILALSVNNGKKEEPLPILGEGLGASDLLLASRIETRGREPHRWEVRPGVWAWGLPLDSLEIVPLAGAILLPGEDFAFLIEVYGLDPGDGVTRCEIRQFVERLTPEGKVAYAVGSAGRTSSLIRFGIHRWVYWASVGLPVLEEGNYRFRVEIFDENAYRKVERSRSFRIVSGRRLAREFRWGRFREAS